MSVPKPITNRTAMRRLYSAVCDAYDALDLLDGAIESKYRPDMMMAAEQLRRAADDAIAAIGAAEAANTHRNPTKETT